MTRSIFFVLAFVFLLRILVPVVEAAVTCPSGFSPSTAGVCVPTSASTGLSSKSVGEILSTFLKWLLGLVSVIALIAFVISGIQYLTAVGDEGQAETAKQNIKYAIIGVVVALSGLMIISAIDQIFKGDPSF